MEIWLKRFAQRHVNRCENDFECRREERHRILVDAGLFGEKIGLAVKILADRFLADGSRNDRIDVAARAACSQLQDKPALVGLRRAGVSPLECRAIVAEIAQLSEVLPGSKRAAFRSNIARSVKSIQRAECWTDVIDLRMTSRPMPAGSPAVIPMVGSMEWRRVLIDVPCLRFPCTCI